MGTYIDIVLRNTKTGEEKVVEFWSAKPYFICWKDATERAEKELNDIWTPEGDGKYWVIDRIADATRR